MHVTLTTVQVGEDSSKISLIVKTIQGLLEKQEGFTEFNRKYA